jgi:hypothetical protein
LPAESSPGALRWTLSLDPRDFLAMSETVRASRSQHDSVGWFTPTSASRTFALTVCGPTLFATIRGLNFSEYNISVVTLVLAMARQAICTVWMPRHCWGGGSGSGRWCGHWGWGPSRQRGDG